MYVHSRLLPGVSDAVADGPGTRVALAGRMTTGAGNEHYVSGLVIVAFAEIKCFATCMKMRAH